MWPSLFGLNWILSSYIRLYVKSFALRIWLNFLLTHFHQDWRLTNFHTTTTSDLFLFRCCLFVSFQWGPQWRTRGPWAGGAKAPRTNPPLLLLLLPPDHRRPPQRSLCPAAVHSGMLPHSSGPFTAVCAADPRRFPRPQPLDQISSPPRARWSNAAVWLAFPAAGQPVRANRGFRRRSVGGGGASSGGAAAGDPLSAVAAAAGGLERGGSEGAVLTLLHHSCQQGHKKVNSFYFFSSLVSKCAFD